MNVCPVTSTSVSANEVRWDPSTCTRTWNAERTALALEALQHSGVLRLRLRGESMLPTLWPGDVVEIVICSAADLQRGDIVLAVRNMQFVVHRLVRFSVAGDVMTRGDSMPQPDPLFPAGAIVGKVVQVTRGGRALPVSRDFHLSRRLLGILLCYSSLARRIALRLHSHGDPSFRSGFRQEAPARAKRSLAPPKRLNLCNLTSDLCNRELL